jgi:hypothetical protein
MKHQWLITILLLPVIMTGTAFSIQSNHDQAVKHKGKVYPLFPVTLDHRPDILSPLTLEKTEFLLVSTKAGKDALVTVTMEDGKPLLYSRRIGTTYGKDKQLLVDSGDFPALAKTGLHSELELDSKVTITGYPVSLISYIGRPGRFSGTGFMADDEDLLSVLKGDNRLVSQLGLTHPHMAKPLFHVWNLILKEIEVKTMRRFPTIQQFYYNGHTIQLSADAGKGWQVSIFQDEIQGRFDIRIRRDMSRLERSFLAQKYPDLATDRMEELIDKISSIRFSEMAPYYIMRYGFYEGHTDYRTDPVAIAYVFGLKSLQEIENAFQGKLYSVLSEHFTSR